MIASAYGVSMRSKIAILSAFVRVLYRESLSVSSYLAIQCKNVPISRPRPVYLRSSAHISHFTHFCLSSTGSCMLPHRVTSGYHNSRVPFLTTQPTNFCSRWVKLLLASSVESLSYKAPLKLNLRARRIWLTLIINGPKKHRTPLPGRPIPPATLQYFGQQPCKQRP